MGVPTPGQALRGADSPQGLWAHSPLLSRVKSYPKVPRNVVGSSLANPRQVQEGQTSWQLDLGRDTAPAPRCELIGLRALSGHGRGGSWSTGAPPPFSHLLTSSPGLPLPSALRCLLGNQTVRKTKNLSFSRQFRELDSFLVSVLKTSLGPVNTVQLSVLLSSISISFPQSPRLGCL